jgi:uncharacterized membrane protein
MPLGLVLGRLSSGVIIFLGLLVALVIAVPGFTPGQLVSVLGISSVAIGFAFRDILQNFLAGILLLLSEPFRIGDQIVVDSFEGTVEDIQTRATFIKTYDGRRIVIPNGDLFTKSVTVNTAYETRRLQYDIGIGYGDDIGRARQIMLDTVRAMPDVLDDPAPDAIVVDLAGSSVNIRLRWWVTPPRQVDILDARDRVLERVKNALVAEGIDLPFPTQQILFHDQTEETDGDRSRQREGWPKGQGEVPQQYGVSHALLRTSLDRKAAEGAQDSSSTAPSSNRDGTGPGEQSMRLRLQRWYEAITDSFWFLPALMAILAAAAALGSVELDHSLGDDWVRAVGWVWAGSADGARSVLSVVAGSVMTVVSIVFSITITALAQTSSHFGPRVLRNFTADRGNQFVLGTFIATFVYCLLILRTVRSVEETSFVPYLSVNFGVALALASMAVLIYFIHHVSQSIQAENLIAEVGGDFQRLLPVLFPERIGHEDKRVDEQQDESNGTWEEATIVESADNGYVHRLDNAQLMRLACAHDLTLRLDRRPGDFVTRESPLLRVLPPSRFNRDLEGKLRACFSLGTHRTPYQDIGYPLQQLVEIAAHALSPGINEPYTALTCIDWLGASLRGVAGREIPSPMRRDNGGQLRVLARPLTFRELSNTAFDQIRLYGAQNPEIAVRLLDTIAELAPHLRREDDCEALLKHAQLIGQDAQKIGNESDRRRIEEHLSNALRALAGEGLIVEPGIE